MRTCLLKKKKEEKEEGKSVCVMGVTIEERKRVEDATVLAAMSQGMQAVSTAALENSGREEVLLAP